MLVSRDQSPHGGHTKYLNVVIVMWTSLMEDEQHTVVESGPKTNVGSSEPVVIAFTSKLSDINIPSSGSSVHTSHGSSSSPIES